MPRLLSHCQVTLTVVRAAVWDPDNLSYGEVTDCYSHGDKLVVGNNNNSYFKKILIPLTPLRNDNRAISLKGLSNSEITG